MGSQTDSGLEKEHSFVFDAKKPPVRKVAQNEKFVVSTRDAVNGQIRSENVLFTAENLAPMSAIPSGAVEPGVWSGLRARSSKG